MPPAQAKARGKRPGKGDAAAEAAAAAAAAGPPPVEFMPLSEEEIAFCWQGLVDCGSLSPEKLKQFMQDVCGESLSTMQARDLLAYMDANGDGVVGRADFENFMSIGQLADTNPKDFMWTPKRLYRQEHGSSKPAKPDIDPFSVAQQATAQNMLRGASASGGRQSTAGSIPEGARRPSLAPDLFGAALVGGSSTSSGVAAPASGEVVIPAPVPEVQKGPEPKAPPGKRRGPPSGRAARAAAAAAEQSEAAAPAAPASPASAAAADGGAGEKRRGTATSVPRVDEKTLAKIQESINKYEQESWATFLKMEEDFKESLFAQNAGGPDGMSPADYHKVLLKWQKIARKSMPSSIRPADSLSALQYVLQRDGGGGGAGPKADSAAADGKAPAADGGGEGGAAAGGDDQRESRLTYRIWSDIVNGKHRPEEHRTVPAKG